MIMKQIEIGKDKIKVPAIGLGCMRITGRDKKEAESLIKTAMENGANFFDHADIYAKGEAESFFAEAISMNPAIREKMILQTKCAIKPRCCYDFSKEHILNAVDGSLKRLKTDYVDFLLLHRPDALMEPEEVAEAFSSLEKQGKVRYFGVSNHNSYQIELLNKYCNNKIVKGFDICFTTEINVFLCRNQDISFKTNNEHKYRRIVKIEKIDSVPTRCIEVNSPTHTFLVGKSFIPTHNTNKELFNNFGGKKLKLVGQNLLEDNFNKYQLQLSFYQILLEEIGYKVKARILVWLKEKDGKLYQNFYCKDYTKELRNFLKKDLVN